MDALIPFTTSGSLVDLVDKKVMVVLRDGRKLIGVFRSYDQYANFLLESTVERLHYRMEYADEDIGVLLIRGENVVMVGEVDLIAEDLVPLQPIPLHEIKAKLRDETARKERDSVVRDKTLDSIGFVTGREAGDNY